MQSEVSEISPVLVEVKVQVPWDHVQKGLNAEYTKLARTAKVRGFRPGKVPRHVVKQLFGKQVKAEVTGSLVEAGLMAAVEQHEIQIVAQPKVDSPSPIKDGKPFEFTAQIEVRPAIEAIDLEDLKVYVSPSEVSDDAVNEEVLRLRKTHADVREPDPMRPAKDGDQLTIAYKLSVDGEVQEELSADEREVTLGEGEILDEFEAGLAGAQPGDVRSVEVPFADDHPNDILRGKTGAFEITISALKERLLPEEDDEFAKDCGDFETLLELRLDIRKRLQETADQKAETELKDKLIGALIAKNDIPVPPSLVQQQKQQMLYEMMSFAQMFGRQVGPEDLEGMDDRALRRVKAGMLLGALARIEGIDVGDDAVEAKLQEMAEETGKHIAKLRVEYSGERGESLANSLLEEKLIGFLKTKATLEEGPDPDATEDTATEDAATEEE
ncbi:MAG: trigger factor [Myxococcota bacterium]